jgi:hypothetical protein
MHIVRIVSHPNPAGRTFYDAEIWTPTGSPIHSTHDTSQDALDWVESIMPGIETRWWVKPAQSGADHAGH